MRPLPLSLLLIASLCAGLNGCKDSVNSAASSVPQVAQAQLKPLLVPVCLNDHCGLLDQNGQVLREFSENALAARFNLDEYFKVENGQWVVARADGSKIADFGSDIRYLLNGLYGSRAANNEAFQIVDASGKVLSEAVYDELTSNYFGEYIVYEQNGKSGLMDQTGKPITPAKFDEITAFSIVNSAAQALDFVLALQGKQQWLINYKTGAQMKVPYSALSAQNDGLMVVSSSSDDRYVKGVLDRNGKLVIGLKYENLGLPSGGLIDFTQDSSSACGYLDYQGKTVIPAKFAACQPFGKTAALAKAQGENGKWGMIDRDGNWLQTPKWEYAEGAIYSKFGYLASPGKAVAYDADGFSGRAKNSTLIDTDTGKVLFSGTEYQVLGLLDNAIVFSTAKEKESTYSMGDTTTVMPGVGVMDLTGKVAIASEGFLEINSDASGKYWMASINKGKTVFTKAAQRLFHTPWPSVQARPDLGVFVVLSEDANLNLSDPSPNVYDIKAMYALDGRQRFAVNITPCGAEQLLGPDNQVIWPKDPTPYCKKAK